MEHLFLFFQESQSPDTATQREVQQKLEQLNQVPVLTTFYLQWSRSGIRCLLTPESGMNNPVHNSEGLETIFWVKILKFSYADPDLGFGIFLTLDPGIGMENIRIRDKKHPGSATLSFQIPKYGWIVLVFLL
jgi:hypothetical protein